MIATRFTPATAPTLNGLGNLRLTVVCMGWWTIARSLEKAPKLSLWGQAARYSMGGDRVGLVLAQYPHP